MHVLYFHQHFTTPRGASGTRSYEMAQALLQHGHTVTIVCGSYAVGHTGILGNPRWGIRRGMVDGINVIEICLPYSNRDSFSRRTLTFLKYSLMSTMIAARVPYDLLFATSTPLTAAIPGLAMRMCKPRLAFVFEVRDLWPELPRLMGVIKNPIVLASMALLERLAYKAADACIGLAPGIVEGIQRRAGLSKPVAMIPNGCDLGLFSPKPIASSNQREKQGLTAIYCGTHGIANGLDAVLDAARVLKQRGRSDIQLLFVGDGKLKPVLQERARRENLRNCVFMDPIPKLQVAELMKRCDVGMMVLANCPGFYFGTSPNKFFDYIAAGLPVINNYPGWLAELIKQHQCGLVVPPGDAQAFAAALTELADAPAARVQMGKNARRLAEESFDRKKLAEEFVAFLESTHEKALRRCR